MLSAKYSSSETLRVSISRLTKSVQSSSIRILRVSCDASPGTIAGPGCPAQAATHQKGDAQAREDQEAQHELQPREPREVLAFDPAADDGARRLRGDRQRYFH